MPATTNVNMMAVVHAGSGGMAMCFPDVCKTPAPPAPPIPIPYPNISQSSNTADGSTTVKVDGNPIMLKSSNFSTSNGDQAGSLNGVVSSKIMGKAKPMNASMDVKVNGKAVMRLLDPMTANSGSPGNGMVPAEIHPPVVIIPGMEQDCAKQQETAKEPDQRANAWEQSGIVSAHRPKIQSVCKDFNIVIYFRQTKAVCGKWITLNHCPKPHAIITGTTIVAAKHKDGITAFVAGIQDALARARKVGGPRFLVARRESAYVNAWLKKIIPNGVGRPSYSMLRTLCPVGDAWPVQVFEGIVGRTTGPYVYPVVGRHAFVNDSAIDAKEADGTLIPVEDAKELKPHRVVRDSGRSYKGTWVTGDYDLFEVLSLAKPCEQIRGVAFTKLRKAMNKKVGWDCIQHGPQVDWVPEQDHMLLAKDRAQMSFHMPNEVKGVLAANASRSAEAPAMTEKKVALPGNRTMNVIDENVTAVAGTATLQLPKRQNVVDALLCSGCP
jgi:hypothetical protein